jgi:hypothetical protein
MGRLADVLLLASIVDEPTVLVADFEIDFRRAFTWLVRYSAKSCSLDFSQNPEIHASIAFIFAA